MIETIVHNKAQKSWTPLFSNIMIALDLATGTVSLSLEMEYGSGSKFIVSRGARRATVKAIRTITGGKFKEGRKEGRKEGSLDTENTCVTPPTIPIRRIATNSLEIAQALLPLSH